MAHSDTDRHNVAATKSRYLIMLIVLAGTFMSVLDGVVVNIALPTITGRFGVRLSDSQWIVTAYLLTLT
ncbi:MAG: MFS transporter, partial [Bacteroidota bacterium]